MAQFQLKPIDADAVPRALEKAERYRLLAEPEEAESICLDILAIEPDNQEALVMLILALTDQFRNDRTDCYARAQALVPRLHGEYERCYYAGILRERRGSAQLERGGPGTSAIAHAWLQEAMSWYEKAEAVRPPHNDDAILRWNTCARIIVKHNLSGPSTESFEPVLQE
jgi:hypothetical protein